MAEQNNPKDTMVKSENDLDDGGAEKRAASPKAQTISLSEGEESGPSSQVPAGQNATKIAKKRRSNGGSAGGAAVPAGLPNIPPDDWALLKRRKIHVVGAPKMPLSAYVRFMNERRESLRREMPTKSHNDQNKIIAEEWHALSEEKKLPYTQPADADKMSYDLELTKFLSANPDVLAHELAKDRAKKQKNQENGKKESPQPAPASSQQAAPPTAPNAAAAQSLNGGGKPQNVAASNPAQQKRKRTPTPPHTAPQVASQPPANVVTTGEIPIFTNEFLEHNKVFDMELRGLRKSKADLEQQNAVLEKHVENMKFGVEKMTSENNELEEKNRMLEIYLLKLKKRLAQALAGLSIPTEPNGATVENIDKYMKDLFKMATSNTHGPASLNKAKDIIRKLDLQIQL